MSDASTNTSAKVTEGDIESLAKLARIEVSPEERASFAAEAEMILSYVSEISGKISTSKVDADASARMGVISNVMRDDEGLNASGADTENLLKEAPHREGDYVTVKKIIG